MTPINVLYVHHAGTFGGASRSLLEMIHALPPGSITPYLITPTGNVAGFAQRLGVHLMKVRGISQFDCTRFGHYRGLRWLVLLREIWLVPFTVAALFEARRRWRTIQIIHVNDLTPLLAIVLGKLLFRVPLIAHVRAVQQTGGMRLRRWMVRFVVRHYVDRVIAIDETVKASLPAEFAAEVLHNGFALESQIKEDPAAPLPPVFTRASFKAAMIGNLMPMKGIREFVEAARLCAGKQSNIDFIIVGDNVRTLSGIRGWLFKRLGFASDVHGEVVAFIHEHGLSDHVHLIEFMTNIKDVYDRIDVLCFPSHLNAAGRPVFEAAFSKVPSIVAIDQPYSDTIVHRETGLCIGAGDARALADAIEYFNARPEEQKRMGLLAYELAQRNFDIRRNAARMLDIYRELVPVRG